MTELIPLDLLRAYSQGQITRREIGARVGHEVRFGPLLAQLHQHRLPLPRVPSDPHSRGVELIRELASRGAAHAR